MADEKLKNAEADYDTKLNEPRPDKILIDELKIIRDKALKAKKVVEE